MARTSLSDLATLREAACEFGWVLEAGDVAERELVQDRCGSLALEEKAEGLPHDSLEVVVAELELLTEPPGTVTWWVVSRSPSRTWTRNSRGAKGLMLMSAIGLSELVPG